MRQPMIRRTLAILLALGLSAAAYGFSIGQIPAAPFQIADPSGSVGGNGG